MSLQFYVCKLFEEKKKVGDRYPTREDVTLRIDPFPSGKIPFILVVDGDNYYEFFTHTQFISELGGYRLPNSTFVIYGDCHAVTHRRNYYDPISASDTLKLVEPLTKKKNYTKRITDELNNFWGKYRAEYRIDMQKKAAMKKSDDSATEKLNRLLKRTP